MPLMLAAVTLSALLAQAPPPSDTSLSAGVVAGRGQTWDDEGSVGSGTEVGAIIDYRFRPRWAITGSVERLAHHRDVGAFVFSGRSIVASAGIQYHFTGSGVSPYVGGGFGGVFYEGRFVDRFTTPETSRDRTSTSTAFYGNAGVEIPIGTRVAISPDVRLTFCQAQDDFAPWSMTRFGVKALLRF